MESERERGTTGKTEEASELLCSSREYGVVFCRQETRCEFIFRALRTGVRPGFTDLTERHCFYAEEKCSKRRKATEGIDHFERSIPNEMLI